LTKPKLIALATHVELQFKPALRKQAIKNMLVDYLIDDVLLDSKYSTMKIELHLPEDENAIRLKQLEIEEKRLEAQIAMEQEKTKIRLAELAVEEVKAKDGFKEEGGVSDASAHPHSFDPTRYIRFVPPFQEKDVDKYFQHFEKVAMNMGWPEKDWAMLLQTVFLGKAREVYTAMPNGLSQNYNEVKKWVLRAYELVPEAYRQKFRQLKKKYLYDAC